MLGTLVNVGAVMVGSAVGLLVGFRLPERLTKIAFQGIGLFSFAIGVSMAIKTQNWIVMVFSIVLGALAGELLDIDRHLSRFGGWLKRKLEGSRPELHQKDTKNTEGQVEEGIPDKGTRSTVGQAESGGRSAVGGLSRFSHPMAVSASLRFTEGMVTAFLLFCMGSMTVLGAIEEGLGRAPNLLLAKSVLDGFAAIALTATMGIGVVFSVIPLLVYQGGLTLFAGSLQSVLADAVVTEVSAVGGLLLIGLGINILEIRKLKIINMLPALVFAGVLAWFFVR